MDDSTSVLTSFFTEFIKILIFKYSNLYVYKYRTLYYFQILIYDVRRFIDKIFFSNENHNFLL